jgi:prophage DNA circulation protein
MVDEATNPVPPVPTMEERLDQIEHNVASLFEMLAEKGTEWLHERVDQVETILATVSNEMKHVLTVRKENAAPPPVTQGDSAHG